MRQLFLILAACLLAGSAHSQSIDAGAFSLPGLDASARGAGLGGAPLAVPASDPASFLYNPALVSPGDDGQIGIGFLDHLSAMRLGTISYVRSVPRVGTLVGSLRFLGWGSIPRTDDLGIENGSFRANELALSIGGSRAYGERVRYGATLHLLRSAIDGRSVSAIAGDVGILFHWTERRLAVGASIHRIGAVFGSIGSTKDDLPIDVRIGVSKRLEHLPLLLSVSVYGLNRIGDYDDAGSAFDKAFRHLLIGGEFLFSESFRLRLGYDHRRHAALRIKSRLDMAGVSFGAGLRVRGFAIDYAWTSWSSLGGLHRFGLTTRL